MMETCPYCTGVAKLYQETWHTRLYIDKLGRRYILKTETCYCPPYADCSTKDNPRNAAFEINFCPHCGRDLRAD